MKRFISLLIVVAMLITMLVSCKDNSSDDDGGKVPGDSSQETSGDQVANGPQIPDKKYNKTFRILGKGTSQAHWKSRDLTAEDINSDAINNAVYYRNTAVEEKYGITVEELAVADYFSQQTEALLACQTDSDDYDMFCLKPEGVISALINNGHLMNLKDMTYMDLTAPWYDQNSISQLSIANKVYLATGAMLIMDDDATGGIFFNKALHDQDKRMPNFYDLVDEGKWTIDKMTEFAGLAARDENGDDVWTVGTDIWGCLSERSVTLAMVAGGDLRIVDKDAEDIPFISAGEEDYLNMLEKVLVLENNFNVTMFAEALSGYGDVWVEALDKAFNTNHALFYAAWLNRATIFRDMETDFGILPYPKYDENQKDYCSFVSLYCANSITVPKTVRDVEFVSAAIEALSAYSMMGDNSLTEAYYEKTLGAKNIRDEESAHMLDIIFANTLFDLGYMFNWGSVCSTIMDMSGVSGGDASGYARKMTALERNINKSLEKTLEKIVG